MLAILLVPAALTFTYGKMVSNRKHGWIIFAVMLFLWFGGLALSLYGEFSSNPSVGVNTNLEGKETRFGIVNSILWSVSTTAASNGSVNSMHSSLSPIAGSRDVQHHAW